MSDSAWLKPWLDMLEWELDDAAQICANVPPGTSIDDRIRGENVVAYRKLLEDAKRNGRLTTNRAKLTWMAGPVPERVKVEDLVRFLKELGYPCSFIKAFDDAAEKAFVLGFKNQNEIDQLERFPSQTAEGHFRKKDELARLRGELARPTSPADQGAEASGEAAPSLEAGRIGKQKAEAEARRQNMETAAKQLIAAKITPGTLGSKQAFMAEVRKKIGVGPKQRGYGEDTMGPIINTVLAESTESTESTES